MLDIIPGYESNINRELSQLTVEKATVWSFVGKTNIQTNGYMTTFFFFFLILHIPDFPGPGGSYRSLKVKEIYQAEYAFAIQRQLFSSLKVHFLSLALVDISLRPVC
jgi:hypothetical protein